MASVILPMAGSPASSSRRPPASGQRGAEGGEREHEAAQARPKSERPHEEERDEQPDRELRVIRQEREQGGAQHGQPQQGLGGDPARGRRVSADAAQTGLGERGQREEQGRAEEERGGPAEPIQQEPTQDRPDAETDAQPEAHRPEPAAVPLARQEERHQRGRGAVDEPTAQPLDHPQQQHPAVGGHHRVADQREPGEPEPRGEHRPGAQPIRQNPGHERGERVGEDVADDHPADRGRAHAEGPGHRGQRDVDRGIERHEQRAERGQEDGHPPSIRGERKRAGR